MTQISVQGFKINLNFDTQTSKSGRLFRLSGISLVTTKPSVWINKMLTHGTVYTFRYIGTDEFFAFEFDQYGNFVGKLKIID